MVLNEQALVSASLQPRLWAPQEILLAENLGLEPQPLQNRNIEPTDSDSGVESDS